MALGRAARQRSSAQGIAARQTYTSGVNPPVLGGANGQTGSLGTSFATARFNLGGSMFIPTQSSTSQSETTVFTTSATGQTGSLGQTFYSTDTKKHSEATGLTGSLGSSETVSRLWGISIGQTGSLGASHSTSQTISGTDVEAFLDAIVDYDSAGNPISVKFALQAMLAVLTGKSSGFPGAGQKVFKSPSGLHDRVQGPSDKDGNRQNDPTFTFSD